MTFDDDSIENSSNGSRYPLVPRRTINDIDAPETPQYGVTRHINQYPVMPFPYGTNVTEIISVPERPEAIIARRIPRRTARLLEKESERRHYDARLAIGSNVANNLVNKISEEAREEISNIEVSPDHVIKKGFLGFGKEKGMKITIKKK